MVAFFVGSWLGAGAGATTGRAWAAEAETRANVLVTIQATLASVKLNSTGTVCVHASAGSVSNPGAGSNCTAMPARPAPGLGQSKAKFFVGDEGLEPDADNSTKTASTTVGAATTTATAGADWNALYFEFFLDHFFGVGHTVSAQVTSTDPTATTRGRAVGQASDPLEFTAPSSGLFAYTVSLGEIRLKADSAFARNDFNVTATFENASRNGTPLTGPLWSLTISGKGALGSASSITVDLRLWPGLGISAAQETAAETFLRDQIKPLGSGYLGFEEAVTLFGPDGPLPEIQLNHVAGQTVRYVDAASANTELGREAATASVPALSRGAAAGLLLLLVTLAMSRKRQSRSVARVSAMLLGVSIGLVACNRPDRTRPNADPASGLQIEDLKVGDGAEATSGKVVQIHYTGWLKDGTKFDTTTGRKPFQFTLGQGGVLKGWEMGVPGMRIGGKRKLTMAPALAFGQRTVGQIKPNSTLVFEVELLSAR